MPRPVLLRLGPGEKKRVLGQPDLLRRRAALQLEIPPEQVVEVRLRKVSFDARPRHMKWRLEGEAWLAGETPPSIPAWEPRLPPPPAAGSPRVVVVGCGPAGLFCALDLLQAGLRVTILERGKEVQARRRDIAALQRGAPADPDSNYCFGEGGAGTYSDGKLYTRSGKPEAVREILEILVAHGAPRSILVDGRPHIGSNLLPKVVVQLR
ncbi:MAG: FAD-dependent oxidoreductase, partial [Planctomycetota bacterium]